MTDNPTDGSILDYSLETNNRGAMLKAMKSLGNIIGYPLVEDADGGDYSLRPGVAVVLNVPVGGNTAVIPPEYILRPPFVHTPGTYDEDGNEITPPVLSTNWYMDLRLFGPAAAADYDPTGTDEISNSKIKTWLENAGPKLTRPGEGDHSGEIVDYWSYDLADGDWIHMYQGLSYPKHEFYGGRFV